MFAHGSRDPQWRVPIEAVAAQIRQRQPAIQARCAYLELCSPTLPEAAADLAAAGVEHIKIFPVFFGVGKHAREDLPLLVEEIKAVHPQLKLELMPMAGENPALIALMADIALS